MFRLVASTDSGTVEILDDQLRESAAKYLAGLAAEAARAAGGEAGTAAKRRGRPPGVKNHPGSMPAAGAAAEEEVNGVDLAAEAAG
jgi:hypothetical protein